MMMMIICAIQPEEKAKNKEGLQIWVEYLIISLLRRNTLTWEDHIHIQDVFMISILTLFDSQYHLCSFIQIGLKMDVQKRGIKTGNPTEY